jgi:hypothetical protein
MVIESLVFEAVMVVIVVIKEAAVTEGEVLINFAVVVVGNLVTVVMVVAVVT